MRGGPIDLTPFGGVLSAIGVGYWLLMVLGVGLALWLPRSWWVKLATAMTIFVAMVYPVATRVQQSREVHAAAQTRLDRAMELFKQRCLTAGEKIKSTVEGVDGVVWLKWRPAGINHSKQFELDDPYGSDCHGESCIGNLLRVTQGAELNPEEARRHSGGYRFVETIDPNDGQRYRYAAGLEHGWSEEAVQRHLRETGKGVPSFSYRFSLTRQKIDAYTARYGITWDDISTPEDREFWIAGGSLKVVDLRTGDVLAERIGFMVDQGQGATGGFRSPWPFAEQTACPAFAQISRADPRRRRTNAETRAFAVKVLEPQQQGER